MDVQGHSSAIFLEGSNTKSALKLSFFPSSLVLLDNYLGFLFNFYYFLIVRVLLVEV